jgi:hypothetical protein
MPIRRHLRIVRSRGAAAVAATGLALVLVGCAGAAAPTPTPSSGETPAPIFASDEEALAAAEAVYGEYLTFLDEAARAGSEDLSALNEVLSPAHATKVEASLRSIRDRALVPVGSTTFDTTSLVSNSVHDGKAIIDTYACLDVSGVRIHDASGADVTSATRDERSPMQLQFVSGSGDPRQLVLNAEEPWPGDDFC